MGLDVHLAVGIGEAERSDRFVGQRALAHG